MGLWRRRWRSAQVVVEAEDRGLVGEVVKVGMHFSAVDW